MRPFFHGEWQLASGLPGGIGGRRRREAYPGENLLEFAFMPELGQEGIDVDADHRRVSLIDEEVQLPERLGVVAKSGFGVGHDGVRVLRRWMELRLFFEDRGPHRLFASAMKGVCAGADEGERLLIVAGLGKPAAFVQEAGDVAGLDEAEAGEDAVGADGFGVHGDEVLKHVRGLVAMALQSKGVGFGG